MKHYICKERYKLELHWDSIEYTGSNVGLLKGAYFTGPVLKQAAELQPSDFIDLDFTPQLVGLISSYYIVRLSWQGVEYKEGRVNLSQCTLINEGLKEFHKLGNSDYVIIDTEKHEEAVHAYNLVYDSQIIRGDGSPYSYA